MTQNIETQKLASNKIEAQKIAEKLDHKKIEKKEAKQASAKQEASKEAEIKQELKQIAQSDLSINAWGDLFFSKAHKEIAKNADFQLKLESEIYFLIDSSKREIAFREKQEADQISENSFFCYYKKRCANRFYFRKEAQNKLEKAFNAKVQALKFSIQFNKDKSGLLKIQ
jgi:hypothetical protein